MLPPETKIEIIATKENKHYKMIMTVAEWKMFKKKIGFKYQSFQLGFSKFSLE